MRLLRTLHNRAELVEAETLLPHQQQCANYSANHPGQKGVRSKITTDKFFSFLARATCFYHSPNTGMWPRLVRIRLIWAASKSPKVLAPQQCLARLLHEIHIQHSWIVIAIACQQRCRRTIVPDRIAI